MDKMRVMTVVGTRPEIIKLSHLDKWHMFVRKKLLNTQKNLWFLKN